MNTYRFSLTTLAVSLLLIIQSSCKKTETDPTKGFSAKIQSIISQADIDKLRQRGMIINEGLQPPNIEGIYVVSPYTLISPYDGDTYKAGDLFGDLVLRFSQQNNTDLSAIVELKQGNATGNGIGGFLAGNGTRFTFFAEVDLRSGSATAKQVRIFSGEVTSTGIKDFYTSLVITSKNDPTDQLIPLGATRVFKDNDGLASKRSTFRLNADAQPRISPIDDSTR